MLHSEGETTTNKLVIVCENGPRVFSKQSLIDNGYPSEPSQNYYLVYRIENEIDEEFVSLAWDITKLEKYKHSRGSALPFSVTLTVLLKAKVNHQ